MVKSKINVTDQLGSVEARNIEVLHHSVDTTYTTIYLAINPSMKLVICSSKARGWLINSICLVFKSITSYLSLDFSSHRFYNNKLLQQLSRVSRYALLPSNALYAHVWAGA
jgi:hypothetical protein